MGREFNWLVKKGKVQAPIVIGRDHLDTGSVASPNRETEGMKDGSDAIADWPLLNALLNTACGASWVSLHHGGGVGIGYSIHAGMVIVADGTETAMSGCKRVLTADPGTGVMRHADAGYDDSHRDREGARGRPPDDRLSRQLTFDSDVRRAPSSPSSLVELSRPFRMPVLTNIGILATCRAEGGQDDIHVVPDAAMAWDDEG